MITLCKMNLIIEIFTLEQYKYNNNVVPVSTYTYISLFKIFKK